MVTIDFRVHFPVSNFPGYSVGSYGYIYIWLTMYFIKSVCVTSSIMYY